ncbi:SHOCT domain-containing protein [Streptomyces sp. 549]|uniref:SHOCT domain-containing protein n=1 Tax=Streptomyces sp. 549 TaxID=3049076 RepID=UPI0024C45C9E|nr:SHOCT domain-containing protein [Streptomyces sp. 549]MDK1473207.1 SHOCT domain-containing protein [Streptomyces sp. 549]
MDDYPLLNLFWSMLHIFLFVVWFFLLFKTLTDVFRSKDLGGWGKTGWTVLILVLPYLGVLIYLIARGGSMASRDQEQAQAADAALRSYIKNAAGTSADGEASGHVAELAKLSELRTSGALSDDEFQKAKEKLLV